MQNRTLTRREFLAASGEALAGVSALGLAGCGGGSSGGPLNILAGKSTSWMLIMITSNIDPTLRESKVKGKYEYAPMPTIPYGINEIPSGGEPTPWW